MTGIATAPPPLSGRTRWQRRACSSKAPTRSSAGFFGGRPLWYAGDGGILQVAGARAGKLTDILAQNICSGVLGGATLLILDVKGELAAISQDQTPDEKFCLTWNPFGLHGLPHHRLNPFSHLRWSSKWLFSDMKVAMAALLAKSGAAQAQYFELNARRIGEALGLTLVKKHGVLTLPDLYDAVLRLQEGGDRWTDFAWEMHSSGIPLCRSVEAEIHAAREDGSGGFKGILGELMQSVACLSDPVLRESLSPPFDGHLSDRSLRSPADEQHRLPDRTPQERRPTCRGRPATLRQTRGVSLPETRSERADPARRDAPPVPGPFSGRGSGNEIHLPG